MPWTFSDNNWIEKTTTFTKSKNRYWYRNPDFGMKKKTTKKYYICNNYGVFTSRNRTIYGQRKIDNNSRSNS